MSIVKCAASVASIRRAAKILAAKAPGETSKSFFGTLSTKGMLGIKKMNNNGPSVGKIMSEYSPEMQVRLANLAQKTMNSHTENSIRHYLATPLKGQLKGKRGINFGYKLGAGRTSDGQLVPHHKLDVTGLRKAKPLAASVAPSITSQGSNHTFTAPASSVAAKASNHAFTAPAAAAPASSVAAASKAVKENPAKGSSEGSAWPYVAGAAAIGAGGIGAYLYENRRRK